MFTTRNFRITFSVTIVNPTPKCLGVFLNLELSGGTWCLVIGIGYRLHCSDYKMFRLQMIMNFEDIEQISKERTVKLFPNAIQFRVKGREKPPTFTSFTQRDRAFLLISKLLKNSRKEKVI